MSSFPSTLTIDLNAIAHNWHCHAKHVGPALCSAVVKADAYGLGAQDVSRRLYQEGCRAFHVASLHEAQALKPALGPDARIFILSGLFPGEEKPCIEADFVPVIVSVEMLRRWVRALHGRKVQAALKIDTGMGRLGIAPAEHKQLLETNIYRQAGISWVFSHLACSDQADHPQNALQLAAFLDLKNKLTLMYPDMKYSFANSGGCALGPNYFFDMVRPGIALYGGRAGSGCLASSLLSVASLSLKVIQLREVPAGQAIGYGATSVAADKRLIAVVAGGYADGIFRYLGNRGMGYVNGHAVPIAGRISMDSTMFDVTAVSAAYSNPNAAMPPIELLCENQDADALAESAGTASYEVLTSLGARYGRCYLDAEALDLATIRAR